MKSIVLFAWLLAFSTLATAQEIPPVPHPATLVNDYAKILTEGQVKLLEAQLVNFSNTNTTQIVILTQNGVTRELRGYCSEIINTWGIGQADRNNGVLIFIDPQERRTYLATGTGTEVWLPNSMAQQIVDKHMLPAFQEQNFYKGITNALIVIMSLAEKAYPQAK